MKALLTHLHPLALGLTLLLAHPALSKSINTDKSRLLWVGEKVTGKHYGSVGLKQAQLKMTPKGRIAHGEFIVDMNSIKVTDLEGQSAQKFLGHIKGEDFFEVQKYPEAKLVITKDDGQRLYGKMKIKGKEHPISFPYQKQNGLYKGQLTFDRTKFGIIYGSGNFFQNLGDKMIDNEVNLEFQVYTN